jgi:hypothetical protein
MFLLNAIKSNPKLKKFAYWPPIPRGQAGPRLWVRLFINPFTRKRGQSTTISYNTRICTHALTGAGSVTTKNIPLFSFAVRNPARFNKKYNFETISWQKV